MKGIVPHQDQPLTWIENAKYVQLTIINSIEETNWLQKPKYLFLSCNWPRNPLSPKWNPPSTHQRSFLPVSSGFVMNCLLFSGLFSLSPPSASSIYIQDFRKYCFHPLDLFSIINNGIASSIWLCVCCVCGKRSWAPPSIEHQHVWCWFSWFCFFIIKFFNSVLVSCIVGIMGPCGCHRMSYKKTKWIKARYILPQ